MYTYELGLVFWGLLLFFLLTNFNALQKSFLGIYQFSKTIYENLLLLHKSVNLKKTWIQTQLKKVSVMVIQ